MTLLITGSTGFLGSELVNVLASQGESFDVLARNGIFRSGKKVLECLFNLAEFQIPSSKDLVGYSQLVHLAWNGLPNYESKVHLRQVGAHKQLVLNAVDAGIEAIFVSGTCLEYGLREGALSTSSVAQPTTAYGHAKIQLLQFLQSLKKTRIFTYAWGRFFYLYGGNQNATSLYPSIQRAIKVGAPLQLLTNGMQIRDFISVQDATFAILKILREGCDQEIVNVGSGNPIRVKDWVNAQIPPDSGSTIETSPELWPNYEPFAAWAADPFN